MSLIRWGRGDFEAVPEAFAAVSWRDTVALAAGTHAVGGTAAGWPIELSSESPVLIGIGGASQTTMLGDGATAAFVIPDEELSARVWFSSINFRDLGRQLVRWSLDWQEIWADPKGRGEIARDAAEWSGRVLEFSGLKSREA